MSWAGQWPSTNQFCAYFTQSLAEVSIPNPGLLSQLSEVPALFSFLGGLSAQCPPQKGKGNGHCGGGIVEVAGEPP